MQTADIKTLAAASNLQNEVVSEGFTLAQLDAAFKRVAHIDNWKFGNSAWIGEPDFKLINAATIWYAGSPLKVLQRQNYRNGRRMLLVFFTGYYAEIGA